MKCRSMASSCVQRAGDCGDNDPSTLLCRAGLARKSVDHQYRGLHGTGAEPVQGFLAVAGMGIKIKGITERELEAARTARAVRTARANARASELAGTIKDIQASGVTTLLGIAAELNRHGIPTATGRGKWCGTRVPACVGTIARIAARYNVGTSAVQRIKAEMAA
jgi:hypothetical protein